MPQPKRTKQAHDKVDVNSATADQLKAVRGIGKSRALEIVRFRDKHGPFTSLEELERVPHMGDMPWGELDALPHFRDEPEGQRAPIKARLRV